MENRSTRVVRVDANRPDAGAIEKAAAVLRQGGLVAFPTETVYGLGADASSPGAVEGIFRAKQRPSTNPLIVHVGDVDQARRLASRWPDRAEALAEAFWPGPLTVVVPAAESVPDAVTAGLDTVALRLPSHPVARGLIEAAGVPVAAPSANLHTEVSPTTAEHVLEGLEGRIDLVVDAGAVSVGVESTLVSVVDSPAEVLRPGMIDRRQLSEVVKLKPAQPPKVVADDRPRPSPGLAERHYSPRTSLRVVDSSRFARLRRPRPPGRALVAIGEFDRREGDRLVVLPDEVDEYARRLYETLHRLDRPDVQEIVVECPPDSEQWEAIRDRLRRAASSVQGCRL